MSAAASWSYTSTATHWPRLSLDDWTRVATYGPPVKFACDYSAEATRMTDVNGQEFTSRQILHTERSSIQPGDFVLIGASAVADPVAAGAFEVRAVTRFADTFQNAADDYKVAT